MVAWLAADIFRQHGGHAKWFGCVPDTIGAGDDLTTELPNPGTYDLSVHGPNGFFRHVAGSPGTSIGVSVDADHGFGLLTVQVINGGRTPHPRAYAFPEVIDIVKWSSLGTVVVVPEATQVVYQIVSQSYRGFGILFLLLAAFYLLVTATIALLSRRLEHRLTSYRLRIGHA